MIKSYIKTAMAHMLRNKTYSFISILSLAIGFAVCILLFLYVRVELSFDRYHKNADNIYRLCNPDNPYHSPQTAKLFADHIPEIKAYARVLPRENEILAYNDKRFIENRIAFADASFFRIFSFKFRQGDPETALQQPGTVVISAKTASKYFGKEDPIGKVLKLDNEANFTVSGVMEEMPQNSHFHFDIILSLTGMDKEEGMNNWGWQNFLVYVMLPDHFSKPALEAKCNKLMKPIKDLMNLPTNYSIQNLKDIHLYSSKLTNDVQPQNSILYVLIFSAIAFMVLLISCFNYINLVTASSTTRMVEIGMRKACGASRKQLAFQFIFESFLMVFISLILALLIIVLCLPLFNGLSGKDLSFSSLITSNAIQGMIAILLIIGILAGGYPAFILSSYNPVKMFRPLGETGENGFHFRKLLVGAQFTIVMILITVAIVMFRQIRFLQHGDLGFNKEYVLVTEAGNLGNEGKYLTLKRALLDQNSVVSVSTASRIPSMSFNNIGMVTPQLQRNAIKIPYVHVHFDYFNSLNIKAEKGRLFSDSFKTDPDQAVILNEVAVKFLGITGDPVGQTLGCNWPQSKRKIVGVVNDFHFESLYEKIKPAVFLIHFDECRYLIVKVKPTDLTSTIQTINKICKRNYPDQLFEFHLLDNQLEQLYQSDERTFHLMGYFALLAIFLAGMGLFGIASFIITNRTKEIGIRKVNGATVSDILKILNMSFFKWIALAFVIAIPVSWYVMERWLENFAYRTGISWWIFMLTGLISIVITLVTTGFQSYRAATVNPVKTLKTE